MAELAARAGKRVALVERNEKVCTEASGAHHGWFHFGSLYSIFPNNQFMRTMVGGIDDLLDYYRGFPGLNVAIDEHGRLKLGNSAGAWIRDEPIEYIVAARNDPDFDLRRFTSMRDYLRKVAFTLGWDLTIKQFISRHQRFHKFDWRQGPASMHIPKAGWLDYSREVIHKPKDFGCVIDPDTHFKVIGFDRPMNARTIAKDLLASFVAQGGTLMRSCAFTGYERRGSLVAISTQGSTLEAENLVIAAGRWLNDVSGIRTSVVASPLLVAYPRVCEINWARLTPFTDRTINHLKHYANGQPYSLIGGGYFAAPDDQAAVEAAKRNLLRTAEHVFPQLRKCSVKEIYVSYKTEIVAKLGERNYQYFIRQHDRNVYALVPGKFSLAFSLAVNAFKQIYGEEPSRTPPRRPDTNIDALVYVPLHEQLVQKHLHSVGDRRHAVTGT